MYRIYWDSKIAANPAQWVSSCDSDWPHSPEEERSGIGGYEILGENLSYCAGTGCSELPEVMDESGLGDGDGSFDPDQLLPMLDDVRSGRADAALGRRRPVDRRVWPWHARLGNNLIVWWLRRRLGMAAHDIAPMRVLDRRALLELDVRDRHAVNAAVEAMKLGAFDYIVKPFEADILVLRLQNILKRTSKIIDQSNHQSKSESNYNIGRYVFDAQNYQLKLDNDIQRLTEKEAQLIEYFFNNKNQMIKRDDLLTAVWGSDDFFSGRSMDVFISRLRKYFKNDSNIKIESARGVGLTFKIEA